VKTVVVVGGDGFLGRAICRYLGTSFEVIVWDVDRDLFTLSSEALRDQRVAAIVNLSVVAELSARFLRADMRSWHVNVQGVSHLVDCARESGATFIQFSTREVLGPVFGQDDVFESDGVYRPKWEVTEAQATNPQNAYGQSKLISEWLTQTLANGYVVRLATPYSDEIPKVGGGLVPALLRNSLSSRTVQLTQGGKQFRDPVHVLDIAAMVERLITRQPEPGIYNCGHGGRNLISLIELVKLINSDIPVEDIAGGDLGFAFDTTRARQSLGWVPEVLIRERLPELIEATKLGLGKA